MKTLSRLLAGGLVGFALMLAYLGHPLWLVHALGAAVAVAGAVLVERSRVWGLLAVVAVVAVYLAAWWS